jgi:hypothetical protein
MGRQASSGQLRRTGVKDAASLAAEATVLKSVDSKARTWCYDVDVDACLCVLV